MLTALDEVASRIEGLDCGADDYLIKPYDFGELLARLRAVIRRGRQPVLPDRLTTGSLVIDTRRRHADVRGTKSLSRQRNMRCSNTSPGAPAMSSAGPTSRSTCGMSITIRFRTSLTYTSSVCVGNSSLSANHR
jgi:hypothetical protein